jgi:molybdopterin converting factor small subunit
VTIHVKLYGTLRYYKETVEKYVSGEKVEVAEGTSAGAIVDMLHLPERVATILIVNGVYTDKKKILKDGDVLYLIAPVSGG